MFYEEEEREADRIRTKFLLIKRRLQRQLEALERKRRAEEEDLAGSSTVAVAEPGDKITISKEGESLC